MTKITNIVNPEWRVITIGYERTSDDDFAVIATFNNNDDNFNQADFISLVERFLLECRERAHTECIALEREDAPDYIQL